ncbi:glycogen/starch/alpha-glucan family phosphorylase [Anaerocolumna sedimenticola]|uniref:Alpha-1,4 glucan phosphorylase n=1 Tax=Anaerocolumna sedimenticola TaxID=2696063 RepID=A0A6P1TM45_9FIRM|nr:glycogen/starch/alpha-glucan phosphorylase [Anaerocolumna sedimenticola]QHQ60745.1 glycogen/starch/alpha-glucan family phosphorylase [Anaerocolumna sedimenticola]
MEASMNKEVIKRRICTKLNHHFGVPPENATLEQFYRASVMIVQEMLIERRRKFVSAQREKEAKSVYYLCMEFLIGRSLRNNLFNLGILEPFEDAIKELNHSFSAIFDLEPDSGLGNGGLGRLAACFLDAAASLGYPVDGYSIRYEFGIFRQKIIDGWQTELPDLWLHGGEVWLTPRADEAVTVKFDGQVMENWGDEHHIEHINYKSVLAIPYDMMISGYDNTSVSLLRLWSATNLNFDIKLFNQGNYMDAVEQKAMAEVISNVLYPSDNHMEGKSLRLRQQYFLVSASIQDIIRKHLSYYETIDNLSDKVAIHINETHPALAIPELMRILLDEWNYGWEDAWTTVTKTFAYTNHTVMSEALEVWPEEIFKRILPRIYQLVQEINNRFCHKIYEMCNDSMRVSQMAIINCGQIHMANLCICACFSVNGVSKIHSNIIKTSLFRNFSELFPSKFINITNGFSNRRWLCQSNPNLCGYIAELIGPGFETNPKEMQSLLKYADNQDVLMKLAEIKKYNKLRLADYIKETNQIIVNPDSIFDVQIKRLHEYKRQLLNALHILLLYDKLKENPNMDFYPRTFIFGAKAAPGYHMAKQIIRLICSIANEINKDKSISDKLKVVFLEDYRVSLAELIIPAAEISEQISLAGTEASGTGNMKLMINGAITLGTMDGANVEISEAVGEDNILIFGLRTNEVEDLKKNGYYPSNYYNDPNISRLMERLKSGVDGVSFQDIANSLIGGQYGNSDPYMVLADFEAYRKIQEEAASRYRDKIRWNKMSLVNIAASGRFSADRAIEEYSDWIWKINKIKDVK